MARGKWVVVDVSNGWWRLKLLGGGFDDVSSIGDLGGTRVFW